MCYYNGQKVSRAEYIRLKQLEKAIARFDFLGKALQVGFDYGMNAVVKPLPGKDDFDIVQMEWGFIPHYLKSREEVNRMRHGYKDARGKFHPPITTLNAISEELLSPGKIYREAALKRRCLVLSSGFYEWRHVYPLNKRTGLPLKTPNKYPYYITVKEKEYFFMAGIWQPWTDKLTGEYVESFAIVTTAANKLMEQVHNSKKRMPTILSEELAYEWIFGELDEHRIREIAMFQYPPDQMQASTIAKDFRDSPDPASAFHYNDLPALELKS
jgi:putative SOS response-associated peptidase YedK